MKQKPIIFNTEMAKAILDGKKTQTRRMGGMALEVINENPGNWKFTGIIKNTLGYPTSEGFMWFEFLHSLSESPIYIKPKYQPGDHLWVRETWCLGDDLDGNEVIYYRASQPLIGEYTWKSPYHMFKKYARIWLEVLSVRVERVQKITEEDVWLEGVDVPRCEICGYSLYDCAFHLDHRLCKNPEPKSGIPLFINLWDSINKKRGYGWESNPWVWVIEFRGLNETNKYRF